jgi:hypothetical protein
MIKFLMINENLVNLMVMVMELSLFPINLMVMVMELSLFPINLMVMVIEVFCGSFNDYFQSLFCNFSAPCQTQNHVMCASGRSV